MPELTDKVMTIRFDGAPPTTESERAANRYPSNDQIRTEQRSEIFGLETSTLFLYYG